MDFLKQAQGALGGMGGQQGQGQQPNQQQQGGAAPAQGQPGQPGQPGAAQPGQATGQQDALGEYSRRRAANEVSCEPLAVLRSLFPHLLASPVRLPLHPRATRREGKPALAPCEPS